jgi:ketosteroid isomerase-like protein
MANQIAGRKAGEALNGGKTKFVTTIEGPVVSVHGDVAVASFVRWWNVYPHNKASNTSAPTWVTLVLIKEGSGWLIKHVHQSPLRGN